jgi:acyl-CoA synthetase (AMP-forming)/AMP-acid ligase II
LLIVLKALKEAVTNFRNKSVSWPENLSWITIDALRKKPNKNTTSLLVESKSSDLAFLQFTSGSTSTPKGVMITHGNLADNLTKITTELEADRDTIVVSWLPQYHDMGLIGSLLGILYCGGRGFYMSPLTYLQRPSMWIEAISKYRATHLQAPNFAFKLTARKFDASKYTAPGASFSIDLSSVKHMINAAEPVTEEGITAFCETFCPFGFDKDVIFPTFGLAEHTVFVCSGGKQRLSVDKKALEVDGIVTEVSGLVGTESSDVSRLIGCGFPAKQNVDVKIVDTETFAELGNDRVGEVWIRSDSKAAGYYEKPFETKRDFCAMIGQVEVKDDTPDSVDTSKGYLRSGDLGFLHNDELFICGRIKDLIIIGGRNYYPQDIESTAEATDAMIRPGCLAAFTVDPISGGDEEVALVLELREVPKAQVSYENMNISRESMISTDRSIDPSILSPHMQFTILHSLVQRCWKHIVPT